MCWGKNPRTPPPTDFQGRSPSTPLTPQKQIEGPPVNLVPLAHFHCTVPKMYHSRWIQLFIFTKYPIFCMIGPLKTSNWKKILMISEWWSNPTCENNVKYGNTSIFWIEPHLVIVVIFYNYSWFSLLFIQYVWADEYKIPY